jgi:thiol-disulfide isomerase/thioredoxin
MILVGACGGDSARKPSVAAANGPAPAAEASDGELPIALGGDDFQLLSLAGDTELLSQYRKPVTVISMWASFCPACQRELPMLEALHRHNRGNDDVAVIVVGIDELEVGKLRNRIRDREITAPVLLDANRQLFPVLAPKDSDGEVHLSVPLLAVVDAEFRLRRKMGPIAETSEAFIEDVQPLVDAARRGEEPPPLEAYESTLGSSFNRQQLTFTVDGLTPRQRVHYLEDLRHQLREKYPELSEARFEGLMAQVAKGLEKGGTFTVTL